MSSGRSIALVDDNEALGRVITRFLVSARVEVDLFHSGEAFLQMARLDEWGCVILDLEMPGISGLGVLNVIKDVPGRPCVLFLTGHGSVQAAVSAMKLGAVDFLQKPYSNEELLAAVEKAIAETERTRAALAIEREAAERLNSLSRRQHQVLLGLATGKLNKIIAYELGLSMRTVEAYRAQLLDKLGVSSTAEAVRIAIAGGLIEASAQHRTEGNPEIRKEGA